MSDSRDIMYEKYLENGEIPSDFSPESEVIRSRLVSLDYNLCRALFEDQSVTPLEQARSALVLGDIGKAEVVLAELAPEYEKNGRKEEILLERARAAVYRGQFEEALRLTSEVVRGQPDLGTRMAAFQVRSVASYEMGLLKEALNDVASIRAMALRFTKGYLAFGAESIAIKSHLQLNEKVEAEVLLKKLWSLLSQRPSSRLNGGQDSLDLNCLHTLVRIETESRRIEKLPFSGWSELSRSISLVIGDIPYHRLSLLDIATDPLRPNLRLLENLKLATKDDLRLERYLNWSNPTCLTAKIIATSMSKVETNGNDVPGFANSEEVQRLETLQRQIDMGPPVFWFGANRQILIDLARRRVLSLSKVPMLEKFLKILSDSSVTAAEVTLRLWGVRAYSSIKHDPTIRRLLQRLKIDLGLETKMEKGVIQTLQPVVQLEGEAT